MSSNITNLILSLNNASSQLNRYFSIFIFIFGIFGNLLNCLVLSQRSLRTNPCSFLFLISSIASLISILSGLTTRMLAGYAVDLTNTISWLCKLRAFILFTSRNIASWLLTVASIDRWFSSSINHQYRQKSSLKNAYKNMFIIIIFSILLYIEIFYCYESNLINTPLKCYGKDGICRITTDLSYALITLIIPIIIMIIFGLMTISNVQSSYRRVCVTVTANIQKQRQRWKKTEYHLLLMLLIQILLYSFFTLPQAIQKIYSTITADQIKTALQTSIENLVFNLLLLLTYFSSAMPFYIYTLCGGKIFRKTLIDVLKKPCTRSI
jgi:hypothetical protein